MEERQIKILQDRLSLYRRQIEVYITLSIREELASMRNEHSIAHSRQIDFFDATQELNKKLLEKMDLNTHWQAEFTAAVDGIQKFALRDKVSTDSIQEYIRKECSERFRVSLFRLLTWSEMETREESIAKAHYQTFEWIFNSPDSHLEVVGKPYLQSRQGHTWSNFRDWLESNDSLYWITGKPGSGKSTLMKFIYHDARTKKYLEKWTAGQDLFISSFYFWNSGVQMQMSQEGLLQSLLYDALRRLPHLIPTVFPTRLETFVLFGDVIVNKEQLSWTELVRAFRLMLKEVTKDSKVFLLIDGLDEYDGVHTQLIDFVHSLLVPNVKTCISSRPWNVFEDAFSSRPNLRLEHLTYPDIKHYAFSKLSANLGFQALREYSPENTEQLIVNVATKASGVFLWVVLVTQSLREGLSDGEHLSELQQRLDSLPAELETLFWKILGSVHLEKASRLFQIHRAARYPFTLGELSFADDENLKQVLEFPIETLDPKSHKKLDSSAELMRRRLNACCKGLLEAQRSPNQRLAFTTVRYLHRTVKDWFANEATWQKLIDATSKTEFDLKLRLCASQIGHQRTLIPPVAKFTSNNFWKYITRCIDDVLQSEINHDQKVFWLKGIDHTATELEIKLHNRGLSWFTIHTMHNGKLRYAGIVPFVYLAVNFQIIPYVESILSELQQKNAPELEGLLDALLESAILEYSPRIITLPHSAKP